MDLLLTPEEAAQRLKLSRRTVIAWLQAGRLGGVKVGNRWRVREQDLSTLIDDSEVWFTAELGRELPPYDWGPEGEPVGRSVRYDPGQGLLIQAA